MPKQQGGMRFCDIHCFNLALLAKQACRLVDNLDSLCATILKAKYFPDSDLLNAKLKKGASFTWQSIMSGVNTLKHGYISRVGDGTKINIWSDAWVPGSADRKIITPRGQNIISKVGDLIDPVTRQWDEELVDHTFWHVDVH